MERFELEEILEKMNDGFVPIVVANGQTSSTRESTCPKIHHHPCDIRLGDKDLSCSLDPYCGFRREVISKGERGRIDVLYLFDLRAHIEIFWEDESFRTYRIGRGFSEEDARDFRKITLIRYEKPDPTQLGLDLNFKHQPQLIL